MKAGTGFSDVVGQALSVLCIVHCALTPVVLAAMPALTGVFGRAHPVLLVLVLGTALWAFVPGYRHHRDVQVLVYGLSGVALLAIGTLGFGGLFALETGFTVAGAGLMLVAHWKNRSAHAHCRECATH